MEQRYFVVIYGLPGAGKSTVCKHVQSVSDFYYADIGAHTLFATGIPMWRIALDAYEKSGKNCSLVTEGVLSSMEGRDRFAENIWRKINRKPRGKFAEPQIFYINEPLAALHKRRPSRSIAKYEELAEKMEIGSNKFKHHVIDVANDPGTATLEGRTAFILSHLLEKQDPAHRAE